MQIIDGLGSANAIRVSIVIVTYRSRGLIDRCLAPLADRDDIEIIIWENASGDGIGDHIRAHHADKPRLQFIESPVNLGFAGGNNRAFAACRGGYVLLLNPDAFLDSGATIDALADFLDAHPDVAMAGPRLVNADGSHQVGDAGNRLTWATICAHALLLQKLFSRIPALYLTARKLHARCVVDVDWVCCAAAMVRRAVIDQVGGLDERIFLYGEDLEWGTRMRDAGWRVCQLPRLQVTHTKGQRRAVLFHPLARRYRHPLCTDRIAHRLCDHTLGAVERIFAAGGSVGAGVACAGWRGPRKGGCHAPLRGAYASMAPL